MVVGTARGEGRVVGLVQRAFFAGRGPGVIVDVGAARPDYLSVSAHFRSLGWRVIVPGLFNPLLFLQDIVPVPCHLAPGGIYVQWAPTARSIETFRSIFPYVTIVHPAMLGSDRPRILTLEPLEPYHEVRRMEDFGQDFEQMALDQQNAYQESWAGR